MTKETAVIGGVGERDGLGARLGARFGKAGLNIAIMGRHSDRLAIIADDLMAQGIKVHVLAGDASAEEPVERLFSQAEEKLGPVTVACFNAGARAPGAIADIDAQQLKTALEVGAYAGFLVGRAAARRMAPREKGSILFTGATASLKGYANSAAFAMSKFALRGLAQSMARELGPKGIHVAHVVIDGAIASERMKKRLGERYEGGQVPRFLDAGDIAETFYQLSSQPRSAWTFELELRPWVERF